MVLFIYFLLSHNNEIGNDILVNARIKLGFRLGEQKITFGPKLWTYLDVQIWIGMSKITISLVLKLKNFSSIGQYTIQDPVPVGPEISRLAVHTLKYPDMSVPMSPIYFKNSFVNF